MRGAAGVSSLPLFCMDTHAIYWHRIASPRLGVLAAQVFADGVLGKAILVVPYIVVAELFYLLEKRRQLGLFPQLLGDLQTFPYYRLEPLTIADLASLHMIPELHDRFIALAAKRLSATIVT